MLADFLYEKTFWKRGFPLVIGVDEVGRGALAGPVVAGAAALKIDIRYSYLAEITKLGIDDSKRLTPKRREELAVTISQYFHIGIGEASVEEINEVGIVRATERAMKRAIKKLKTQMSNVKTTSQKSKLFFLVDGIVPLNGIFKSRQQVIVAGDQKSISIAAASIVAKVYRDSLMRRLACEFAPYGWDHNVGYGTTFHLDAIMKHGVTMLHRVMFVDFLQ